MTLTRQYRVGELPYTQYPHRELLEPWIKLVKSDDVIARITFVMLVKAIVQNLKDSTQSYNERSQTDIKGAIFTNLLRVLQTGSVSTPLAGAIFELAIKVSVVISTIFSNDF